MIASLEIQLDSAEAQAQLREVSEALQAVPEGLREQLLGVFDRLRLQHGPGSLSAAPRTGDNVVRLHLSLPWVGEFLAAARLAQDRQIDAV